MSLQQQHQKIQNNGGTPRSLKSTTANGTVNLNRNKRGTDNGLDDIKRERIVLWYHPLLTLKYCALETVELLRTYGAK